MLRINGSSVDVDVAPDTPLLWVLRDTLGLQGTKFGCGLGLCGACTVHIAGAPVRSCQTPVSAVGNYDVTRDGRRFIMVRDLPRPPISSLSVVVNWFADLERRMQ